ncbi:MAG: response regulator [Acidobacteriota bacterium]|nr:response regulator [Acidobacteriota bacterium]
MRILIVDDEESIVELLSSVCLRDDHDVASCTSSNEAMSYLKANRVDLLITDIAMGPPDGLQLIREAREIQPKLLAIAITGYAGRYGLEEVLAAGASDLMFKPFRMDELRARVALADERRRTIDTLNSRRQQLQQMSADMIRGLEQELQEARRPASDLADRLTRH